MEHMQSFLVTPVEKRNSAPTMYELVIDEHNRLVELLSNGEKLNDQEVDLLTSAICNYDFTNMNERHHLWTCLSFWNCQNPLKPLPENETSESV